MQNLKGPLNRSVIKVSVVEILNSYCRHISQHLNQYAYAIIYNSFDMCIISIFSFKGKKNPELNLQNSGFSGVLKYVIRISAKLSRFFNQSSITNLYMTLHFIIIDNLTWYSHQKKKGVKAKSWKWATTNTYNRDFL